MAGKTYNTYLSLTGQIAFCSMPLRLDTYRGCPFQCRYCFAAAYDYTNRQTAAQRNGDRAVFEQVVPADPQAVIRAIQRAFEPEQGDGERKTNESSALPFLRAGQPLHWGGVADPFSYSEARLQVSLNVLRYLASEPRLRVVVSTKSTMLGQGEYYELVSRMKDRFLIQVSILGDGPMAKQIEPAAPSVAERIAFVERLASEGFHVIVRIQPYFKAFAQTQPALFRRYGQAGVRGVVVEGLKVPGRITEFIKQQWGEISAIVGHDLLAEFKSQGRNTGGDYEYSFADKLRYAVTLRKLAHRNGLAFYAADNDMRLLSDSPHCCGSEWVMGDTQPYAGHITAMAYQSPQSFSAQQMLPETDPRMQVMLNFLNLGSAAGQANARALFDGRLYGYLRHRFNDPAWVRRVMPQAEVLDTDGEGDVHYRIAPAFLKIAEADRVYHHAG